MVKMFYPAGVNTYRDGEWKPVSEAHALVEVPDALVDGHLALGYTVLQAITVGLNVEKIQELLNPKP